MQDKTPYNKQGQRHGYWEGYYTDGSQKIVYKGNLINDEPNGLWERYYPNSKLMYKKYYAT